MFLKALVNEENRRINFDSASNSYIAGIVGDFNVDGITFYLPDDTDYFAFSDAVVYVIFFDSNRVSHKQLLSQKDTYSGMPKWAFDNQVLDNDKTSQIVFFLELVITNSSGTVLKSWISAKASVLIHKHPDYDNQEEQAAMDTEIDRLAGLVTELTSKAASIGDVERLLETITGSSPQGVAAVSDLANADPTKLYLVAADGRIYYYLNNQWNPGPVYGSYSLDSTLTQSGQAADAKATGDRIGAVEEDIEDVKEDLSAIQTATSEDIGKALKAKTVTNGKVTEWEFGDAGGADPETIEQAVTDWLDEHPEATTTVADGSITEAKLATALVPTLKNNYVTPEMFGAVGDGVADDAQAFIDMFSSGNKFFFIPAKTYILGESVDIGIADCTVLFNNTTFKPVDPHGNVSSCEYLIGLKALRMRLYGEFSLNCNYWINIGLFLSGCGASYIESVRVGNARLWGVCMNSTSGANNGLVFGKITASQCGYKITAKAKYKETNVFELTDISERLFNTLTLDAKRSVLNNAAYNGAEYVIDDSGYTKANLANRAVYKSSLGSEAFMLNDDGVTGTFTMGGGVGWLRPSADFVDGENGRNVFIPVGGGVKFGSAMSEGVFTIISLVTASNPISFYNNMGYGGRIGSYSTEFDSVVMVIGTSFYVDIDYMYAEGVGSGMTFDNLDKRIFLITENNLTFVNVHAPFHGQGRLNFYQYNRVVLNAQLSGPSFSASSLNSTDNIIRQAQAFNYAVGVATFNATIHEHSPKTITAVVNGFNANRTFIIDLGDKGAKDVNMFSPVTAYIRCTSQIVPNPIKIIFGSGMVEAGYSIHGAVDNVLSIDITQYGYAVKITFVLFGKIFYVTAEPLTFVDNTQV